MLIEPRWVKFVDTVNRGIRRLLAALLFGMACMTVFVVVLRYGFSFAHVGLQEEVTWMYACLVILGAGAALLDRDHVRVDLFYGRCTSATRRRIDRAGILLLLLPLCAVAVWTSLPWVVQSWKQLEGSREAGGLPGLFLLKTVIPVAALLLGLQGLADLIHRPGADVDAGQRAPNDHG